MDDQIRDDQIVKSSSRRTRNIMLALVLAAFSLAMYASIFWRLSTNPLE